MGRSPPPRGRPFLSNMIAAYPGTRQVPAELSQSPADDGQEGNRKGQGKLAEVPPLSQGSPQHSGGEHDGQGRGRGHVERAADPRKLPAPDSCEAASIVKPVEQVRDEPERLPVVNNDGRSRVQSDALGLEAPAPVSLPELRGDELLPVLQHPPLDRDIVPRQFTR